MPLFDRLQIDRAQRARFAVTQISDEMTADKPACPADNNVTIAIVQEFGILRRLKRDSLTIQTQLTLGFNGEYIHAQFMRNCYIFTPCQR